MLVPLCLRGLYCYGLYSYGPRCSFYYVYQVCIVMAYIVMALGARSTVSTRPSTASVRSSIGARSVAAHSLCMHGRLRGCGVWARSGHKYIGHNHNHIGHNYVFVGSISRVLLLGSVLDLTTERIDSKSTSIQIQLRTHHGELCRNAWLDEFEVNVSLIDRLPENSDEIRRSPSSDEICSDETQSLVKHFSCESRPSQPVEVLSTSAMVKAGIYHLDFVLPSRPHLYECRVLIHGEEPLGSPFFFDTRPEHVLAASAMPQQPPNTLPVSRFRDNRGKHRRECMHMRTQYARM